VPFSKIDDASIEPAAAWFYDQSSDGFAISKGGVILKVNKAWCDLLGVSPEEAVGQTAADIVPAGELENYDRAEANLRERGEDDFELTLETPKGPVWVKISVKRAADGYALIAAKSLTDERRQAADDQAASEIHALLWSNASILTWTFSPAFNRFLVDASHDGATGSYVPAPRAVDLEEMLQQVDESERDGFSRALLASVISGEAGDISFRQTGPSGRRTSFRACWRGLRREESGQWQLAGLTQDLTELMDARDAALEGERLAREAGEVKARFLANMSHEFRTPLNGVLGVLHLLNSEPLSESARALLDEAVKSGRTLTALLNDLIDLSDLDAGKLSLSREPVDVGAVIESVLGEFKSEVASKGLYAKLVMPSPGPVVVVDELRLRQILAGFVSNSAKFTDHGGLTIRLKNSGDGEDHRIRIEVEDSGIGIPPEILQNLFTNFRQGDDKSTRQFGGAGVGLSLSRRLARLMGGDAGALSEAGQGSTFWVEVPAPLAAEPLDKRVDTPFDGLGVLVVDDNATNRLVATKILEQLGAVVDTAKDGAVAVAAVAKGDFDLVLMDIQMPVMDGIDATLNIRALPAPLGDIPIVAMTANVSADQVKSYHAAGMNGVIAKPVSPAAIITEIARLSAGDVDGSVYRLIYHSRASAGTLIRLNEAMGDILSVSRRLNKASGVTGALLGCAGWFLQALEGPRDAIEAAFQRISADDRHEKITITGSGNADHRMFGEWSMTGGLSSPTDRAIVEVLGKGLFNPPTFTDEQSLSILLAASNIQAALRA
jgi:PAS domain S-box-containing protein